jgi:hypothetical protein
MEIYNPVSLPSLSVGSHDLLHIVTYGCQKEHLDTEANAELIVYGKKFIDLQVVRLKVTLEHCPQLEQTIVVCAMLELLVFH